MRIAEVVEQLFKLYHQHGDIEVVDGSTAECLVFEVEGEGDNEVVTVWPEFAQ